MSLRIWLVMVGLLGVVGGTVVLFIYDAMTHRFTDDLRNWGIVLFVWVISIPNIIKLRQMITDQGNGQA